MTLTNVDAVDLLEWLSNQPQYRHYQLLDKDMILAWSDELVGLPITLDEAKDVCRAVIADGGPGFPAAQVIYRRCLQAAGILAPPWPEAMRMIRETLARPDATGAGLPGPVARAVEAKGGLFALRRTENEEATFAQLRDTYAGFASAHDRFVLAPGGLEAFAEACQWVAAVRAEEELMANGRWAAMELGWDPVPEDRAGALAALADYEAEFDRPAVYGVQVRRPARGELRDRSAEVEAMARQLVAAWSAPPPEPERPAAGVNERRMIAAAARRRLAQSAKEAGRG